MHYVITNQMGDFENDHSMFMLMQVLKMISSVCFCFTSHNSIDHGSITES